MLRNNDRPSFGTKDPRVEATASKESKRPPAGSIWEKTSASTQTKYMNISLKISKNKLQELLNLSGEDVSLRFVAFPNRYKNNEETQPDFKIYEELPIGSRSET